MRPGTEKYCCLVLFSPHCPVRGVHEVRAAAAVAASCATTGRPAQGRVDGAGWAHRRRWMRRGTANGRRRCTACTSGPQPWPDALVLSLGLRRQMQRQRQRQRRPDHPGAVVWALHRLSKRAAFMFPVRAVYRGVRSTRRGRSEAGLGRLGSSACQQGQRPERVLAVSRAALAIPLSQLPRPSLSRF